MSNRANIQYRMAALDDAGDEPGFSGYAAHHWSVDSYYTAIKPGAFRKTLRERGSRIPVLWQHDTNFPIGRPTELKEDKTGLRFSARISENTTHGRDVMALLRDEVPLGMSFGFATIKDRAATDDDPLDFTQVKTKAADVRVIEEIKLYEISAVTFAANEQAVINDVRAQAEADALHSLIEHIRAGTLTDEHAALVADLVAAFEERQKPEPSHDTPLPGKNARRIDIALALHGLQSLGA